MSSVCRRRAKLIPRTGQRSANVQSQHNTSPQCQSTGGADNVSGRVDSLLESSCLDTMKNPQMFEKTASVWTTTKTEGDFGYQEDPNSGDELASRRIRGAVSVLRWISVTVGITMMVILAAIHGVHLAALHENSLWFSSLKVSVSAVCDIHFHPCYLLLLSLPFIVSRGIIRNTN